MRGACAPLLRSIFGLEVSGLEHVPAEGPFILAANHHNYLDGVVLGVAVPRPIHFLVMPRVFHASPLHPPFHRSHGLHPDQPRAPRPGRHQARPPRARGRRRRRDLPRGAVQPRGAARTGAARRRHDRAALRRARRARGDQRHLRGPGRPPLLHPPSHPLAVRFGQPLHFHQTRRRRASHADREEITRRIMGHIAALLDADGPPAAQRGEAGAS